MIGKRVSYKRKLTIPYNSIYKCVFLKGKIALPIQKLKVKINPSFVIPSKYLFMLFSSVEITNTCLQRYLSTKIKSPPQKKSIAINNQGKLYDWPLCMLRVFDVNIFVCQDFLMENSENRFRGQISYHQITTNFIKIPNFICGRCREGDRQCLYV